MADRDGGCCGCCCSFIFTLGLTALFMWLSLRTSNPKCSIQTIYLPSLINRTSNQTTIDPTFNLSLRLDNPNKDKGIRYDTLDVTVYDFPNKSHVIGKVSIQGFYQGHKKKATKPGQGTANTTVALQAVFENGTGTFRVDMVTAVKFKIMFWYTKKHHIWVGADVVVNASNGAKVEPKGIRLRSMAPKKMGRFCVVVGALVNFLFFTLINFWCGSLLTKQNLDGDTPLHVAARAGHLSIVDFLENNTVLHEAVREGHLSVVQFLLKVDPKLASLENRAGESPLYLAARGGMIEIVNEVLTSTNKSSAHGDSEGQTAWHAVVIERHYVDSAELVDLHGHNALHTAIISGKGNVIRFMLETAETEGLINQPDNDGNTPLHLAAMGRKTWIARYLIWDKRVDRRAKNKIEQNSVTLGDHF
ncbi:hypothetical protein PTKIN_Ptkin11bG0169100 [Pterospermum kingtungense]